MHSFLQKATAQVRCFLTKTSRKSAYSKLTYERLELRFGEIN